MSRRGRQTISWLAAGLAVAGTGFVPATTSDAVASSASAPARRVLVLSLPHVTWAALGEAHAPNLDALVDRSGVADLAVRVVKRQTPPGDGYTTLGAGTRAEAPPHGGLALAPSEVFEVGRASDVYRRRTGREARGAAVMLSLAEFERRNDALLFDAELGALGRALEEGGWARAVIANADILAGDAPEDFQRQAVAALMDPDGVVPEGRVDRGLLVDDPDAPFGLRLDPQAVLEAFDAAWRDRAVVLVEASDVVRAELYRPLVSTERGDELVAEALAVSDRLVGRMLERVDLARDAVVIVAPASPRRRPEVTVAALSAPGVAPSLLKSSTTRRSGFLTTYDVGATILDLAGVERPASMEGRPAVAGRSGGSAAERREFLAESNEAAVFRDTLVAPMAALVVWGQIALAAAAVLALRFGRGRPAVGFAALVWLGLLPATYLAGLVEFAPEGYVAYALFLAAVSLAVAGAASATSRRRPLVGVAGPLVLGVGVIVGNVVAAGSTLQFNTVFGDSPIVAGRFTGINNLTFAQLVVSGVVLAVLVQHGLGGRRGAAVGIALLASLLVVDGLPAWGADIGGVLTLVPVIVYVGYRLWGAALSRRTVAVAAASTVATMAAFALYDLSRPADARSHLGRLLEQAEAGGSDAVLTVVARKALNNLSVITHSVWGILVVAGLLAVAYLLSRRPPALRVVEQRLPALGVVLGGVLLAAVLGFALNDSGIAVPGMMLGVLTPVLVHLALKWA